MSHLPPPTVRTTTWTRSCVAGLAGLTLATISRRAETEEGHAARPNGLVRTEIAVYRDDNLVSVFTPGVMAVVEDPGQSWSVAGSYYVDAVTAASVDVVSSASPRWREIRHAGTLSGRVKRGDSGVALSGATSREPDYFSVAVGVDVFQELRRKTVTPSIGYSYEHDIAGRVGTPYSVFSREVDRHAIRSSVTLILGPASKLLVAPEFFLEMGNQAHPYRHVPMFSADGAGRIERGATFAEVNQLRLPGRTQEWLPSHRRRMALSARFAHRLTTTTFVAEARAYADDWGIEASTTGLRLTRDLTTTLSLWGHARAHIQSSASFWRRAGVAEVLDGGVVVPDYRTGDRELSALHTGTLGIGTRWDLPWLRQPSLAVIVQADVHRTDFRDALYITQRLGWLTVLQVEARFE